MRVIGRISTGLALVVVLGGAWIHEAEGQTEAAQVELLSAPRFEPMPDPKSAAGPWFPFEGGYAPAAGAGPEGSAAVTMSRAADGPSRGIKQNVVLNQKQPAPLRVSGWSRATNVSGLPDSDYSLYCDITYADGTNSWGENAPFRTGTHDWDLVDFSLTPAKPIQSLTIYGLFRNHTGQVWFAGFSLKGTKPAIAAIAPGEGKTLAHVVAVQEVRRKQYTHAISSEGAAMRVTVPSVRNLFKNPRMEGEVGSLPVGWTAWGGGAVLGKLGSSQADAEAMAERTGADPEKGLMQEILLNQESAQPLYFSGWSRGEEVSGTPDSDYALYADITFSDGSQSWGENAPFLTGSSDWNRAELVLVPPKPIRSIRAYALFRNHTGKVWFRHLALGPREAVAGTADFDGLAVQLGKAGMSGASRATKSADYRTADGLALSMEGGTGGIGSLQVDGKELAAAWVPSGFMVRDVANGSDYLPLGAAGSAALKLGLNFQAKTGKETIEISGTVGDLSGEDRAISLLFALPVDAGGWFWANDVRDVKEIRGGTEYSNTVAIGSGSNGRMSIYPVAEVHETRGAKPAGLGLFVDPNYAAQYRLAYNSATRQLYVVFDFGLSPEKPAAAFRFGFMRTEAQWGIRSALDKLYRAYPAAFEATGEARQQGIWMPFTDVRKIPHWQDFGFRFREAEPDTKSDGSAAYDRANGILPLWYCEPSTWWMNMPKGTPRTYEAALRQLAETAGDPEQARFREARAVISSGCRDAGGRLALRFLDMPWASGAVWSLNPSPGIAGEVTEAKVKSLGPEDKVFQGQYLDSAEGYVTADLDYDPEHLRSSVAPLTFASGSFRPALHKGLCMWDFARWSRGRMEKQGGILMANSVPQRFGFLMPQLDVAGTETNWNSEGSYRPDSDGAMNLRRAWSGSKPYLLLQNTDFRRFDGAMMVRYMERCLFYGFFPSCFSADAATDPYWLNPALYERDRPAFKKYVPLVKLVSEAGWQPVTSATSSDAAVWVERWGGKKTGPAYLTVRNDGSTARTATVRLSGALAAQVKGAKDLVTGKELEVVSGEIRVSLKADQTMVVELN